jgi:hypothetical protein
VAKAEFAARHVKQTTTARTMLTLYWTLGGDAPEYSTFSWVAQRLTPALRSSVDDVSLSIWPQSNPMGVAFDRVFATLARQFPFKQLYVGELGYGAPALELQYWWGDKVDVRAGRRALARSLVPATYDRPWIRGGTFWWYFADEAYPRNTLWGILSGTA